MEQEGKVSFIDKLKAFMKKHASIWQLIKFTLISCIAAVVEITSYMLLDSVFLKKLNNQAVNWFIFHYDPATTGGLGTMIAFLVSTTLAQIVSFITNRKKTFNANNNLAFQCNRLCNYDGFDNTSADLVKAPIIVTWFDSFIHNSGVSGFLGKFLWMFISFLIVFPMNKYVYHRRVDKKEPEEEEAPAQAE